jgi:hypothetical protein
MEKSENSVDYKYRVTKRKPLYLKLISLLLAFKFFFIPLYEFVDVFSKEFYFGWCCLVPCSGSFDGYFFL